jgi:hypothetical protein
MDALLVDDDELVGEPPPAALVFVVSSLHAGSARTARSA